MRAEDFAKGKSGRLVRGPDGSWCFVPDPLPPKLSPSWELAGMLSLADQALGQLAGLGRNLPNPHPLIRPFLRREAVLSSRIEGTQASLSDLFLFEAASYGRGGRSSASDVAEVENYVRALEYGVKRLRTLPVSLRLLRELHKKLMEGVRGEERTPGEFRGSQNWIGPPGCTLQDATYVPPPVAEMMKALDRLEKYLHAESPLPPLVRVALVHYQFEAIHPFLDGNGRIGRLLISLLLCHEGLLPQPLLYLSGYFELNRREYYRQLLSVSRSGTWREWIAFFLTAVREQSLDATWRTGRMLDLWQEYRRRFESARSSALLLRLVDDLFECPAIMIPVAARRLGITQRSAARNIEKLVDAGILVRPRGRKRYRVFVAPKIIDVLETGRKVRRGGRKRRQ